MFAVHDSNVSTLPWSNVRCEVQNRVICSMWVKLRKYLRYTALDINRWMKCRVCCRTGFMKGEGGGSGTGMDGGWGSCGGGGGGGGGASGASMVQLSRWTGRTCSVQSNSDTVSKSVAFCVSLCCVKAWDSRTPRRRLDPTDIRSCMSC